MLDSKKELAVLDTGFTSASTKRSPFHLFSSIFSKKKANLFENDGQVKTDKPNEFQSSSNNVNNQQKLVSQCSQVSENQNSLNSILDTNIWSPGAASRRKNLKIDIETLHLSRQDNPYLKQLERFSLPEETILSCTDLNSLAEKALFQTEWLIESEGDFDLHQHLVRSPPPQFPQNVTHFMYSQANSPKKQASEASAEDEEDPERNVKILNPIQTKKETAVLDPGIREVLEYQKTQLLAGLQHSLNIGQAKFGTAPAHYVPVQGNKNQISQHSQSRWDRESGSRSRISDPHATSSLPGLTSCYFELEQTCRRTTLGPIRIGRTLSDSICHDSKLREIGSNQ